MHWVYGEIRVQDEHEARALKQACSDNELGPTIFVAYLQGRTRGRVIVKSQLANWAMSESAVGAAGFRWAGAATSPLELDELPFDALAAHFHALQDGKTLGAHLLDVAVERERVENGSEAADAVALRLAHALDLGGENR